MTAVTVGTRPTFGLTTILAIVTRWHRRVLTTYEAKQKLRPAFGALAEDIALDAYLTTILQFVRQDTIAAEIAASDIWEVAVAAQSANPDLAYLLEIAAE